ncbi:protein kinase domain-containing protein [Candidatus Uabimicrobium amorphum]|uniref:Protein kinase n=1 Tax=Uabimicrobium amorphum TaxID=2596890 RepID=A0A5S9IT79_UABAM|nr:protein kinase [Candidatus Uabimicrobium amorphum]BBM86205.1 protein kinase [Candidatus Uabimicrobium amorphum]
MDDATFKSLWEKIVDRESLQGDKVNDTYKTQDTFSHNVTIFPEQKTKTSNNSDTKQTFSESQTITPRDTFSKETTIAQDSQEQEIHINAQNTYRDIKETNRDDMNVVYEAWQKKLKRKVTVKKMLPSSKNKSFVGAMVAAYLEHPNIVPIHNIEQSETGKIFLTMKPVKGYSLNELLHPQTKKQEQESQKYELSSYLKMLLKICNAVNYAHSNGIVNCDLKPQNIIVGVYGEVLVKNWDIAVSVDNDQKKAYITCKDSICKPMGTPSYMPPELVEGRGKDISYATDVYLLGGILYEILYRNPPRKNKDLWHTLLEAKRGQLPSFDSEVPDDLINICKRAMAKNAKSRHANVAEFQNELEDFLSNQESIVISNQATIQLEKCLKCLENSNHNAAYIKNTPKKEIEKSKIQLNDMFLESIFSFKNAREIWQGNIKAIQGEIKSRLEYATLAFQNEDINLALSQIEKLEVLDTTPVDEEKINELRIKIKDRSSVYSEVKRHTKGISTVIFSTIILCVFLVAFILVLVFLPNWIPPHIIFLSTFLALVITLVWNAIKSNER